LRVAVGALQKGVLADETIKVVVAVSEESCGLSGGIVAHVEQEDVAHLGPDQVVIVFLDLDAEGVAHRFWQMPLIIASLLGPARSSVASSMSGHARSDSVAGNCER